jgi:hypothetical protein
MAWDRNTIQHPKNTRGMIAIKVAARAESCSTPQLVLPFATLLFHCLLTSSSRLT